MAPKPTYEELEQRIQELETLESERKRVEEKLVRRELILSAIIEQSPIPTAVGGSNGAIISLNEALVKLIGYEKSEIADITDWTNKLYPDKEYRDFVSNFIQQAQRREQQDFTEFKITCKDGSTRTVDFHTSFFKDGLIIQMVDISERKQAEEGLRESEKRFRTLFSRSYDANLILVDEVHVDCNEACLKMLRATRDQVIGKSPDFLSPERQPDGRLSVEAGKEKIREAMETGSARFEWTFRRMDGTEIIVEVVATAMNIDGKAGLFGVWRDITDHKQAEEHLRQSQKMEAIGTLAGGIAHDFNNILSIILGNTELAMDDVPEWNPARQNLEKTKTASLRAKAVVKQLLSFSRKSDPKQKPVNIKPIIIDSLKFLRSSIPTSIDIRKTISDVSGIISADPTQIHQVMMNLCTNAAHAMSKKGGIMEVSLSVIEIGIDEAIQNIKLNQGQYVKLTVSDTGHGIAKEHLDKIFDPYFTTKEVGEGSGIGLSVVHGILKSHDGAISVESKYGKGTTFNVFFPVIEKESAFEEETDTAIPTGNERILLVDDEKSIADMASQMLERLGYTVTTKTRSTDTLETFRTRPDNFDLIISDMSMPEITGDKLAKKLLQIRPDIPIILCTGHSDRINEEKAKSIGARSLIMKPIVKSVLAKTIRKVLD